MTLIRKPPDVRPSEITDRKIWLTRRHLLQGGAAAALTAGTVLLADRLIRPGTPVVASGRRRFPKLPGSALSTPERLTPYEQVTGYNNFYEFGSDKYSPAQLARDFQPRPWTLRVEGLVGRPRTFDLDELLRPALLSERIYRLRCVEGWSMVVPWIGLPLSWVLSQVNPTSKARFVQFTTLLDPKRMPGQRRPVLDWPYLEGLRLDEAMHPLTLLAVGVYGEELPGQNGAPLRLVVPWKYGFKSIKSITTIRLVYEQPESTWMRASPREYGFYANVNPAVDHPRWSQARERRLGDVGRRATLPFNGYAERVAHLYAGMDLVRDF